MSRQRNTRRFLPEAATLEGRTLLSTMSASSPTIARSAPEVSILQTSANESQGRSFVEQLSIDVLGRTATESTANRFARQAGSGVRGRTFVVNAFLNNALVRRELVQDIYQDLLGRNATENEFRAANRFIDRNGSILLLEASVASSQEFYTRVGGNNSNYVNALLGYFTDEGVSNDSASLINSLDAGATRASVARTVALSDASVNYQLDLYYERYLGRTRGAGEGQGFADWLQRGRSSLGVQRALLTSTEYFAQNSGLTQTLVQTASAAGSFQTLVAAIQAAELVDTLGGGPFTVFAPSDAAFAKLPVGTVNSLLLPQNKGQLRDLLLYHVVSGEFNGPEVAGSGLLTTVQGAEVGIDASGSGLKVGGANVVATVRTRNGIIHVVDTVLTIPTRNILQTATDAGQFTTLAAAIQAADLTTTLNGTGPFTVFAPTDAAFAKLPAGTVANLLLPQNKQTLRDILLYHVVANESSTDTLVRQGFVRTAQGSTVQVRRGAGRGTVVNQSNIISPNLVATNGVIQVIDTVLLPPSM